MFDCQISFLGVKLVMRESFFLEIKELEITDATEELLKELLNPHLMMTSNGKLTETKQKKWSLFYLENLVHFNFCSKMSLYR